MNFATAVKLLHDYGVPGGIGTAVGSFFTSWIKSYRARVKEIEYSVTHLPLGLSITDQIHGQITVQWQGQPLVNLYSSTVSIENTTSEDYMDLPVTIYTADSTFLLSERVAVEGSTEVPQLTPVFIASFEVRPGEQMNTFQIFRLQHRREYNVRVLNRKTKATFTFLTTVPNSSPPFLFVEIVQRGVQAKFKSEQVMTFGAPYRFALRAGSIFCALLLIGLAYEPSRIGTVVSMLLGWLVVPIGAGIHIFWKTIKKIIFE